MEIDVSKCQHYIEDDMCDAVGTVILHCSKNNCYYKQLQQLKAELQAYKDKIKPVNFVDSDEYLKVVAENKQLKAENEQLKQYKQSKQASYEKLQDRCNKFKWGNRELKERLQNVTEVCARHLKDCIDTNKKLERIKEVCEEIICDKTQCSLNPSHSEDFDCRKTSCDRALMQQVCEYILQIIKEE